jgi:hypothetical protein
MRKVIVTVPLQPKLEALTNLLKLNSTKFHKNMGFPQLLHARRQTL